MGCSCVGFNNPVQLNDSVKCYFLLDLAFKKTTEQSSTDYNGFSSRAVDENYSIFYRDKTCTHTKRETNPWWRVDLGQEYIVTGA